MILSFFLFFIFSFKKCVLTDELIKVLTKDKDEKNFLKKCVYFFYLLLCNKSEQQKSIYGIPCRIPVWPIWSPTGISLVVFKKYFRE